MRVEIQYYANGMVATILIYTSEAETISVVPSGGNGPTREFQRMDEIVQALLAKEKGDGRRG
jgi:hypothetical protein